MKRWSWIPIAIAIVLLSGCAAAAPVNMALTLPLFRADTTNCAIASADTVTNLSTLIVYAATTAAITDSTMVYTANVAGLFGRPYQFTVQQPTWTTRWYFCVTRDSLNLRACRSNVIARTVTAGPPGRTSDLH
jgi:hypothetical protein